MQSTRDWQEFKTLIIRILKELSENFNKERVSIKGDIETMKEPEMKNTVDGMKLGWQYLHQQTR